MHNPHYCQAVAASLSDAIGCRGFYEHLIPEFGRSPTDPLHLLLLKDLRRTLGAAVVYGLVLMKNDAALFAQRLER